MKHMTKAQTKPVKTESGDRQDRHWGVESHSKCALAEQYNCTLVECVYEAITINNFCWLAGHARDMPGRNSQMKRSENYPCLT